MGSTKKIGQFEYRFSKERGFEWRVGDGEPHRWQLPFGKKAENAEDFYGDEAYRDGYDPYGDQYNNRDDRGYDDRYENNAYDYNNGVQYDRARYGGYDDEFENENKGFLGFFDEYEWLMWVLLVVLPPLGIWILWKKERFDLTMRTVISAISAVWFIILLILIFGGIFGGGKDTTAKPIGGNITLTSPSANTGSNIPAGTPILNGTATPTKKPTPTATPASTGSTPRPNSSDTTEPASSPNVNANATVYANVSGKYYHKASTCPPQGMASPGQAMTLEAAIANGKVACPSCIGTATGTSSTTYYYRDDSSDYHVVSNCRGMTGASAHTEAEALASGKGVCRTCIGYYATPGGKWYHTRANCDGMTGAQLYTIAQIKAFEVPHTACPYCAGGVLKKTITSLTDTVYMTSGGSAFHTQQNCQGMENARAVTVEDARYLYGKEVCDKCVEIDFSNVVVETNPRSVKNSSYVYARNGGQYYHIHKDCTELEGRSSNIVTVKFALARDMAPCPACILYATASPSPGQADNFTANDVKWYSNKGDRYFHVQSKCSNASGSLSEVSAAVAQDRNQSPCPVCIGVNKIGNVYAQSSNKYFHLTNSCSNAEDCFEVSLFKALAYGKQPCPDCVLTQNQPSASASASASAPAASTPKPGSTTYMYLDREGIYHKKSSCSNVASNTQKVALSVAIERFDPCSVCNPPTTIEEEKENNTNSNTYVYVTFEDIKYNDYYHKSSTCTDAGITSSNSTRVTLEWALKNKYERCPKCNPPASYE